MPNNEYLDVLQGGAGAAPANPYLDVLQRDETARDAQFRASATQAIGTDPDQLATRKRVAGYLGAPLPAVDALPADAERAAKLKQLDETTRDAPATRQAFTDADFAKLAHDDADNLTLMEKAVGALKYVVSAPDAARGGLMSDAGHAGRALASGIPTFSGGFYGALAAPAELLGNPFGSGDFLRNLQRQQQAKAKDWMGADPNAGVVERGVMSGFQSAGQNLVQLPLGLANGVRLTGEQAMLAAMGLTTFGQSYGKGRDAGLAPARAIPYGIEDAAAEVITEKFMGAAGLLKQIKAGAPAAKMLMYEVTKEVPGEVTATLWQNFNEWMNVNPDKSVADFVSEQPAAVAETIIATLVGGSTQIGLVQGAQKIAGREQQAQQADQAAQALQTMSDLAAASKVRGRDVSSFERFVAQAAEDGPVSDVYISATALQQSGVDVNALAQASPAVAEQLQVAAATGGDIRIPVEEFAGRIAGTDLAQSLIPHLRTDPGGMSQLEAQTFMQSNGDELQAEIERTLSEKQGDDAFKASRDAVAGKMLEQLNAAGRFTPDVNRAYADMLGNFYAVQGAKVGLTPEQMAERYPLQVRAERLAGAKTLDQATIEVDGQRRPVVNSEGKTIAVNFGEQKAFYDWFGNSAVHVLATSSKQKASEQPPRVVYHGTRRQFSEFSPSRTGIVSGTFNDGVEVQRHGIFFAENRDFADTFANQPGEGTPRTEAVYLSIQNPLILNEGFTPDIIAELEAAGMPNTAALRHVNSLNAWAAFDGETGAALIAAAKKAGYDGAFIEEEAVGLGDDVEPQAVWIAFDPEQVKSATANDGTYDKSDANILSQGTTGARGSITLGDDITQTPSVITLLQRADLSTFLHESGHFYLEVLSDMASREDAPQGVKDDMAAVLAWFGIEANPISPLPASTDENTAPAGAWITLPYPDMRGQPIAQVRELDLSTLVLPELDERGNLQPEKRGYLPGYIERAKAGEQAPNIHVVEMEDGRLRVVDGHRRVMAARAAGKTTIRATVSPLIDTAEGRVPMTLELANSRGALDVWNAMGIEQKREHHETFARGFEAYLFEGRAPSVEMASMFQRFRAWMLNVYRSLSQLNVTLNDEVRSVFDRMLATTQAIQEAEAVRGYGGLFATKPEFMSDDEWLRYQALGQDATQSAIHDLESRSLRDMQWLSNAKSRKIKELQREAESKRKAVRAEVEAEVMAEPINLARRFLTHGELPEADRTRAQRRTLEEAGMVGSKLNLPALKEMYGDAPAAPWRYLTTGERGMATAEGGLHPDVVAELFGFTSGDHLVRELLAAEKPGEKIEGITDQRMLERFGDLTDAQAISRAADEALHDEARTRFVAAELAALEKAMNAREDAGTDARGRRRTVATLPRAARQFAEATIARLKVRNIKPAQYAAAAARAAKAADAAFKKGDIQAAAVEKRNQLVNSYADRAAHAAQSEVEKAVAYFKKFDAEGTRAKLDAEYLDQIDALLARFDLRSGQTLRAIDRRKSLLEWAESQREQGFEPDIPPELLVEAGRKSYKDMTVEELRGLRDTVKQIEHLARLKHKLLTAKDQREYEAVRDEIAASIVEHAGDRKADTRTPTTNMGRAVQGLRRFFAAHVKAATWARVLDGGKDGGPVWEYFIRSANERGDQETTMRAEATEKLSAILAPVFKLGKMGGKGQYFPSIGRSLNRESRIAIALNVGNASNLQRLLGGEGWTMAQVQPVLDSLSREEWNAVQAIWDHFESYRRLIEAKEKRVYGKAPEWLDATPVQTPHGEYRGGYYPVKYDPAASQRAEEHADAEGAKRQLQGAYTSATTRRSFTKTRAEEVHGRPLLYSLAGLYSGVNDVIHDLSWHEWLIDANRLLKSTAIDSAIRNHYGPEAKAQFKSWAADIAEGEKGANNEGEVALGKLRQQVSVAGLGFNVMSAALQGLGMTQSIVRVGPMHIGRGIAQYLASPVESTRSVNERSEFMRNRARTRYRELNELRNKVQGQQTDVLKTHAYVLMMRCQQTVDVPTWLGAYDKAIGEGNDEERAIALADQAVIDAQGGGQTKDIAAIERGGQALKLFTVFYSFMNTAFNLGVAETMTESSKAKLAAKYLMLYTVPAVLGTLLKDALTPGDAGDDDWKKLAKKLAAAQLSYLMGLMVVSREFGEAANIVTGQHSTGYAGPAGVRMVGDTMKLGQQAMQGQFDDSFRKAAINVAGDLLGLPSAQINRTITGTKAVVEGKTHNPAAIAFGFQEKH